MDTTDEDKPRITKQHLTCEPPSAWHDSRQRSVYVTHNHPFCFPRINTQGNTDGPFLLASPPDARGSSPHPPPSPKVARIFLHKLDRVNMQMLPRFKVKFCDYSRYSRSRERKQVFIFAPLPSALLIDLSSKGGFRWGEGGWGLPASELIFLLGVPPMGSSSQRSPFSCWLPKGASASRKCCSISTRVSRPLGLNHKVWVLVTGMMW